MRISGQVFAVTGAGNGIGREVVLDLLRRGGRVAGIDVSETALAATASAAGPAAERLSTHAADITDRAAVSALPEKVLSAHGRVDALVHIAGIIQRFVPVADLSFDEIERVMAVNFWGTVNVDKAFLPLLLQRPSAALVNVSSMGALVPVPGQGAYGASKAAVKLLTETLYAELRETSVAVTLVIPGGVGTNIAANSGVTVPGMSTPANEPPEATASRPAPTVTPADVAGRQIVDAIESGRFRVLIGSDARMLDRISRLSPRRAITLVADRMKALLG